MIFSEQFGLSGSQAHLDFVDVPLHTDIQVFVDPFAVASTRTAWSEQCHLLARDFFQTILGALRDNEHGRALRLLSKLREDDRTRTGYSRREPRGTGVGKEKAELMANAIASSRAFQTGLIEDIEDTALFAKTIGRDTVSDMMINVIHEPLAEYTRQQCELLGVETTASERLHAWRPRRGWVTIEAELPAAHGRSILLVPRSIARRNLSLTPGRFLTDYITHYVDEGDKDARAALTELLQQPIPSKGRLGNRSTHRRRLRELLRERGDEKDNVAELVDRFPQSLRGFKMRARTEQSEASRDPVPSSSEDHHASAAEKIAAEVRLAAANADDILGTVRRVTAGLILALHPVLQHPRSLAVEIGGVAGVAMSDASANAAFSSWRRSRQRSHRRNVLVLTVYKKIDERLVSTVRQEKLMERCDACMAILVAPELSKKALTERSKLARTGLLPTTFDEIGRIVSESASPNHAADAILHLADG